MKKIIAYSVLAYFVFAFSAASVSAQGKIKSIMDYYLDLPDEIFYCEIKPDDLSREFKKKQIVRANVKNGYMLAKSEGTPLQVALFTDDHLGITVVAVNRPCGEGCMCNMFRLLNPGDRGTWREFGQFPSADEIEKALKGVRYDSCEFVLPEFGTDIKVVDAETKKTLLLIKWSGGMFSIKGK